MINYFSECLLGVLLFLALVSGCGGPPPIFPISGKVTLGGKPYERLLVYFRPAKGDVNAFNLGVGETDKNGELKLSSSGGQGISAGEYRVTFSCVYLKSNGKSVSSTEKPDDAGGGVVSVERVKSPYDAATSQEITPVTFVVKKGENKFEFDIPAK
jgi:hypothetical protein